MRHRVGKKKLSRTTSHRQALLRNLSRSLILNGSIETTVAKAKFVKPYVEKLVTKAKNSTDFITINRVRAKLNSEEATKTLFSDIAPDYKNREGGYTRIVKLGFRAGDRAPMVRLEWVSAKLSKKNKATQTEVESTEIKQKPIKVKKSEKSSDVAISNKPSDAEVGDVVENEVVVEKVEETKVEDSKTKENVNNSTEEAK